MSELRDFFFSFLFSFFFSFTNIFMAFLRFDLKGLP